MPLDKNRLKLISVALLVTLLSGCGGRAANLVSMSQYGDDTKSCKSLGFEINATQDEIDRLIPKTNKTGKNVALGVAGWFLIVPWFFMDLSQAEQQEINALRKRYNHLVILANEKGCGEQREEIPDFKNRAAFEAYQNRQQAKTGVATKSDLAVETHEMTLEEAKAKVDELEKKKAQEAQTQNFASKK